MCGKNGINITPNQIASTSGSYNYLADNPPESAKTDQAMQETKDALLIISMIVDILDLEAIQGKNREWIRATSDAFIRYPKWATLVDFENFRDHAEDWGWTDFTNYSDQLVMAVRKPSPKVYKGVNAILDLRDLLHAVKSHLETLRMLQDSLLNSPDKILAEFNRYVNQELKDVTTFSELTDRLKLIVSKENPLSKLTSFLGNEWPRVNHNRFFRESIVHRDFAGDVSKSTYLSWLNEVTEYYEVKSDPRIGSIKKFRETLSQIDEDILWLEEKESSMIEEFRRTTNHLKTTIKSRSNKNSVVEKDKNEIEVWVRRLTEAIEDLRQKVQQEKPAHEVQPAVWLDEIKMLSFDVSSIIDREWKVRREYLLRNVTISDLKDFNKFVALKGRVETITDLFTYLNQSLSKTLIKNSTMNIPPREWHRSFESKIVQERELIF